MKLTVAISALAILAVAACDAPTVPVDEQVPEPQFARTAPGIQIQDLGPGIAVAINDRGQVVGSSDDKPVLWQDGEMMVLSLSTHPGSGLNINSRGQVVGGDTRIGARTWGGQDAFMWDRGNSWNLGEGRAWAVSNGGLVVGRGREYPEGPIRPWTWRGGAKTELPLLSGHTRGGAWGVNERGQVVGYSNGTDIGGVIEPVIWEDGQVARLAPDGLAGGAIGVNDHGRWLVGSRIPWGGKQHFCGAEKRGWCSFLSPRRPTGASHGASTLVEK